MNTYLYRASNLKSTIMVEVNFWRPLKTIVSCDLFIIIFIINFFRLVFSEYTEANATSLIPLDTIHSEKCVFIIGFSCTVWTKMRSLAGSLADGVLADTILILPRPPIPPTNIWQVRGSSKKVRKLVTLKPYISK